MLHCRSYRYVTKQHILYRASPGENTKQHGTKRKALGYLLYGRRKTTEKKVRRQRLQCVVPCPFPPLLPPRPNPPHPLPPKPFTNPHPIPRSTLLLLAAKATFYVRTMAGFRTRTGQQPPEKNKQQGRADTQAGTAINESRLPVNPLVEVSCHP